MNFHVKPLLATIAAFTILNGSFACVIAHPTSNPAPHRSASAEKLLSQILTAYGGISNIKRFVNRAREYKGTYLDAAKQNFKADILADANRYRGHFSSDLYTSTFTSDGKTEWHSLHTLAYRSSRTEVQTQQLRWDYDVFSFLSRIDRNTTVLPEGSRQIGGKTCPSISLSVDKHLPMTLSVDPVTHLVLETRFKYPSSLPELPPHEIVHEFADYRRIDGFTLPFYKRGTFDGVTSIYKWTDIEFFDRTPDALLNLSLAPAHQDPVTVPFTIENNNIILKASINDTDGKLILDTGASGTIVNNLVADAADLKVTGPPNVPSTALFSKANLSRARIKRLTIGNLVINDMPVFVRPINKKDYAALLGLDIIRVFALTIDFDNKKVTFAPPDSVRIPPGAHVLPITVDWEPYIYGRVNGSRRVLFSLDTGVSDLALFGSVSPSDLSSVPPGSDRAPSDTHYSVRDSNRHFGQGVHRTINSLQVGDYVIDRPGVNFIISEKPIRLPGNFLGLGFLQRFSKVTFDFQGERLICVGSKSVKSANYPYSAIPILADQSPEPTLSFLAALRSNCLYVASRHCM